MALIVEDGTGLADANVYATRAEATTYHADRNAPAWAAASDAVKDAALIRATEFLDASYAWRGYIASQTQALAWPRRRLTDDDCSRVECQPAAAYGALLDRDGRIVTGVPVAVKRACMELALLGVSATYAGGFVGGAAGSSATAQGAQKRVKAGSVEVEWFGATGGATIRQAMDSGLLPNGAGELIDRLLWGLFTPANSSARISKS